MRLIIVGAGRTGRHVIDLATRDKHDVIVIEKNEKAAREISLNYDCMVVIDDASSKKVMEDIEAKKADALVATTNDDAINMLIMMIGKEMKIDNLISSVNNIDHISLFKDLGVGTVENPHRINAHYLYHAIKNKSFEDFLDLGKGVKILNLKVGGGAPLDGKVVKDLHKMKGWPVSSRIVVIRRNNNVIIPQGDTRIVKDDSIALLSKENIDEKVSRFFHKS